MRGYNSEVMGHGRIREISQHDDEDDGDEGADHDQYNQYSGGEDEMSD